jgi:tetratricopeptide (TPR) repeat protein
MKSQTKILLFAVFALATFFSYGPVGPRAGTALQPPESATQTEEEESSPEYIEQYNAWDKADKEPDIQKSGAMLIQFLNMYPKSELLKYAESSYNSLLFNCSNERKFEDLETLAEQWLKLHPCDLQTIAYIATAAKKLGHTEKWIQNLIEIYKIQPTGNLAKEIAQAYKKADNKSKYLEWMQTSLEYPENETDIKTRFELMQMYVEEKNFPKAIEYAEATLKAADLIKDPSAETRAAIPKVRHACYDVIGRIRMEQERHAEAIFSLEKALKVEKYSEGYYRIALCLQKQDRVEDAMLWYARAEKQGGDYAVKAKEQLEQIYRAIHNNTLIGIEKIYRKAKEHPDIVEVRIQAK